MHAGEAEAIPISRVKSWGYQIDGLLEAGAIERLAASGFDLIVLEPVVTVTGMEEFDASGMVAALKDGPSSLPGHRRLVLAYVDIGEAERYRTYWGNGWTAPTRHRPGKPDFLLGPDPDGWADNFPVAFWDERWKEIVIYRADSLLATIMELGFDGVYLDWVEAYEDERVARRAGHDGRDAAREMVSFVGEIGACARRADPDFIVMVQNAPYLIGEVREYRRAVDAIGIEDLSFRGEADVDWDDPRSGDIETPRGDCGECREGLARQLQKYLAAGIPVFTVDYCVDPKNAAEARAFSAANGFIPFISRTPLDRLP